MRVWIALYRPRGYDGSTEDAAMGLAIDALNDEMVSAGVRVFVGGLRPTSEATTIRLTESGSVAVSEGPYLGDADHVGGFWVLEVADASEAVAWGRKAAQACRATVEVRPFF